MPPHSRPKPNVSAQGASRENESDAPPSRPSSHKAPRRPLQARGRVRFDALLDTVEAMLVDQAPDEIGFYEIAERAGMKPASVYHFFPTKSAAFLALAQRYFAHFQEGIAFDDARAASASWQEYMAFRHQRAVDYYNGHLPAMKLILGAQPFLEIGFHDAAVNKVVSQGALDQMRRLFWMPFIRNVENRFLIALSIVDAIWRVSYAEHGRITPDYAAEATTAAIAYLRTFLPETLEPRAVSGGPAEPPAAEAS